MAISLTNLKPTVMSKDLSGYVTYLYGPPGVGKTSTAVQFPKPLLIAFEVGYACLPGIFAQDVTTWGEMKQVVRELKKPEVKEQFSTIIIDTVDFCRS